LPTSETASATNAWPNYRQPDQIKTAFTGFHRTLTAFRAEDAGKQLSAEFKTKYSDWLSMNVAGFVRSIYAE
jgi:hypothetical protein